MKCRRTRLKSEVSYSEEDSYLKEKGTRQKEGRRKSNQNYLARKMFQQKHLGFSGGLRYESTPFVLCSTKAVLSIFKVKIYSGTDNFQTTLRQFQRYIYLGPTDTHDRVNKKLWRLTNSQKDKMRRHFHTRRLTMRLLTTS